MEVMIIVVTVAEINVDIRGTRLVDDTAPGGLVGWSGGVGHIEPAFEGRLEVLEHWVNKIRLAHMVAMYILADLRVSQDKKSNLRRPTR